MSLALTLFIWHRLAVPYHGPIAHLGLKVSNLFYLSQIGHLHPKQWLLSICTQDFIVIPGLPSFMGFDPADFQNCSPSHRSELWASCGGHLNGAKIGSHVN